MQKVKLSTGHMKFYQVCTLIGSFCWNYIQFQLKRYRGAMTHDTEEWCKIWKKSDSFFQKWQEFGEFWSDHSEVSNICTLIGSFRAKYIPFDLKKYRGVIFYDTDEPCKIFRKSEENWGNWHEKFGKFWPEHLKVSKLGLLFKVENVCAWNLQGNYVSWNWRVVQNLKRNWLVISKLTRIIWQM